MARWWEVVEEEPELLKTYKECPKCKTKGNPGTECFPWLWVTFVNGVRKEYPMSTPLCNACRTELAGRRAPSYTGPVGGAGFSRYEFRTNEKALKYEPLPIGTLERSRIEFLERSAQ